MPNWPVTVTSPGYLRSIESVGQLGGAIPIPSTPASATWPLANRIIFMPIRVPFPIIATQLFVNNGAAVSGNLDLALYDVAGTKLVSKGSTVQAVTNAPQLLDITDTLIGPGNFYVAVMFDNTTSAVQRVAPPDVAVVRAMGVLEQDPGSFAFPATATFAATVDAYYVWCGLTVGTVL